jgi:hypothetical protein
MLDDTRHKRLAFALRNRHRSKHLGESKSRFGW